MLRKYYLFAHIYPVGGLFPPWRKFRFPPALFASRLQSSRPFAGAPVSVPARSALPAAAPPPPRSG